MPFEKLKSQSSYLHGVLTNGARQFMYRSRISSLLAIPAGDMVNTPRFVSSLPGRFPPVTHPQFRCRPNHPQPHANAFYSRVEKDRAVKPSEELPGASARLDQVERSLQAASSRNDGSNPLQEKQIENNAAMTDIWHQEDVTEPKQEIRGSTAAQAGKAVMTTGVIAAAKIDCFGVSDAGGRYSGFLRIKNGLSGNKATEPSQSETGSTVSSGEAESEIFSQAKGIDISRCTPVSAGMDKLRTGAAGRKMTGDFSSVKPGPQTTSSDEKSEFAKRSFPQQNVLVARCTIRTKKKCPDDQGSGTPSAFPIFADCKSPAHSQVDRLSPRPNGGNLASADVEERLELLRSAMRRTDSPGAAREIGKDSAAKEEQTDQATRAPIQQNVIIKRPSNRADAPRAFWERSYLSRFHLRLFR